MSTINVYRKKAAKQVGSIGAGTFYFINLKHTDYKGSDMVEYVFNFKESEVLELTQEEVAPFEGLPAETLVEKYFPEMDDDDWDREANKLGFEFGGAAMDIMVAQKARKDGYKAIKYSDIELQVL